MYKDGNYRKIASKWQIIKKLMWTNIEFAPEDFAGLDQANPRFFHCISAVVHKLIKALIVNEATMPKYISSVLWTAASRKEQRHW